MIRQLKSLDHIKNKQSDDKKIIKDNQARRLNNDFNIKRQYINYLVNKINKTQNIEQLDQTFNQLINSKGFLKFNTQNFNNNIGKMRSGLKNIKSQLQVTNSKDILDKLTKKFIYKNSSIIYSLDNKLYNIDHIKSKILKWFYQNNNPAFIVADIMRTSLTDSNVSMANYQNFENKLVSWLLDSLYNKSNDRFKKNNEQEQNKNKLLDFVDYKDNVPYLGQDDSFTTQINIFHDRKKLIDRQRRDELIILNRKYPSNDRNFSSFSSRHKKIAKLIDVIEKPFFIHKKREAPYGNHVTHEDKIYYMINNFYDKKYINIDNQERELIRKYKLKLSDSSSKTRNKKMKYYLNKNLNINNNLNIIKTWINIDVNILNKTINSNVNNNQFNHDLLKYILHVTANRAGNFIDMASNKNKYVLKENNLKQLNANNVFKNQNNNQTSGIVKSFNINNLIKGVEAAKAIGKKPKKDNK